MGRSYLKHFTACAPFLPFALLLSFPRNLEGEYHSGLGHRYLLSRLRLQVFYLWRHVLSTAPPFILWWWNLEILFVPLHRSSPFIGGLRCQAIQTEHGPYIAERTQKAVYIVKYLWVWGQCKQLLHFHGLSEVATCPSRVASAVNMNVHLHLIWLIGSRPNILQLNSWHVLHVLWTLHRT
jgi:hypothetical protein